MAYTLVPTESIETRRRIGGIVIFIAIAMLLHSAKITLDAKSAEQAGSLRPAAEAIFALLLSYLGVCLYVDDFAALKGGNSNEFHWYLERARYRPSFATYRHRGQALFAERH